MLEPAPCAAIGPTAEWPRWCCPVCAAELETVAHGLRCPAEGRWFATDHGLQRLLPEERRLATAPWLALRRQLRRDEARERVGRWLGPPPWQVLQVEAGTAATALDLVARGHRVVAVDVDPDTDEGLGAPNASLDDPARLPRAEAEAEALPLAPGGFDLVLLEAALHRLPRPERVLVELRRVVRRGGALVMLATPIYRRRADGRAGFERERREQVRRYGLAPRLDEQRGFFRLGELEPLLAAAGWRLAASDWPGPLVEAAGDLVALLRYGRRVARHPWLVARREG
jgi:SAM-dependent methyltransferase